MKRHRRHVVVAHLCVRRGGLVVAFAVAIGLAAPALARADTVTQWNRYATDALIGTAAQAPPVSVLHLAMVHGAVYDAVNAIEGSHQGYLIPWRLGTSSASKDAAAATAAYRVLVSIVPAQQVVLETHYATSLAGVPDGLLKARGIAMGEAAANAMVAARTGDGRFGPFRFLIGTAPGAWRPVLPAFVNDPNAWLKDVKPFLVRTASQFRSEGPPSLASRRYTTDFAEVKSVGSATSTTRTPDQTYAARYWVEHPAGTWSRIARTISAERGLSIVDNARLFAMLYLTTADAVITVWDSKAYWSFWRPITAIREADTDGNPATVADPNWLPLIPNPPYPDEPSGHTGLSGAFAATLRDFFGTDALAWRDTNNAGHTRSYVRLSDAIVEIIDLRVWSGIHFRFADEHGARIGLQVASWRQSRFFQPVGSERRTASDGR